jgi:ABC-type molybdate transport system substrate-binding protein
MDGHGADELVKRGAARAEGKTELAKSQVGMVVKEGAPKPDIGSVEAFRKVLLDAKSIAYSDSGSGTYLSTKLFPQMGLADQLAPKSRKVRGPPSGEPVAAVVARGEAEIGFQQVSELIHVPGRDLRGRAARGIAARVLVRRRGHDERARARGRGRSPRSSSPHPRPRRSSPRRGWRRRHAEGVRAP